MADEYHPHNAPLGTADDLAIAHEHGIKPAAPRKSKSTKVAPLTTANIKPKKAAKKTAAKSKKKGR